MNYVCGMTATQLLADNIVSNTSTENYSEKFKWHKIKAEHTALNCNTNNMENYNTPFKIRTGGLHNKNPMTPQ